MEARTPAGSATSQPMAAPSPAPPGTPASTLFKYVDVVLGEHLVPRALVLGERPRSDLAMPAEGGDPPAGTPELVVIYGTVVGDDVQLRDGETISVAIATSHAGTVFGRALVRVANSTPGAGAARRAITAWIDARSRAAFGAALWPRPADSD
jgi:hypothetical protein